MRAKVINISHIILAIVLAISHDNCEAQIIDGLNRDVYRARVKLISEFMARFNGEELHPIIAKNVPSQEKMNLCQLFDFDLLLNNREATEAKIMQFVDSVLEDSVKIHFRDAEWYAKVTCAGMLKDKEVTFDLFLTVEPRGNDRYKWVITNAKGSIFDLPPSRMTDAVMLLPNENETGFMRLNSLTKEKDDDITLYSSKTKAADRLAVFNTLVYYDLLNIEYVSDIEYCFMQVPGYIFKIKEFDRESSNTGWLIYSLDEATNEEKRRILRELYNNSDNKNGNEATERESVTKTDKQAITPELAIKKVERFVQYLNNFLTDKSWADSIESLAEGRYSFIISDELSNQLANFHKAKPQKSYRLTTLLKWLSDNNNPVKSIEISDPEVFINEHVRSDYKKKFTMIKCELSTTGEMALSEEAVFFIFDDQIAGIKLVTDCF